MPTRGGGGLHPGRNSALAPSRRDAGIPSNSRAAAPRRSGAVAVLVPGLVAVAGEEPRRRTFRKRTPAVGEAPPARTALRPAPAAPRPRRVGPRAPGSAPLPAAISAGRDSARPSPPSPTLLEDHALGKVPVTSGLCCACALAPGSRPYSGLAAVRGRPCSCAARAAALPPSAPRRLLTPGVTSPRRRPPLQRAELGSSS